jgi:hypothetical protein
MQSQQLRRFAPKLMKICEAQIKTPLTTEDKASMPGISFLADQTRFGRLEKS